MYQKIKYIIIATIVLLIAVVVLTLDANTRYAAKKRQKHYPQRSQQVSQPYSNQQIQQNTEYNKPYQDIPDEVKQKFEEYKRLSEKQKAINNETNNEEDVSDNVTPERYTARETNEIQSFEPNKETISDKEEGINKTLQLQQIPKGYFTDETGKKLANYYFEQLFDLENETYAVISYNENTNPTSYSRYIHKKFYIYKKVEDTYKRANYIFETSEQRSSSGSNISIQAGAGTITFSFNGNTELSRTFDNYLLKNSYKQYSSYPALKYIDETNSEQHN